MIATMQRRTAQLGLPAVLMLVALSCGGNGSESEPDAVRTGVGPCPAPCMELSIPDEDCTGTWPAIQCTVQRDVPFAVEISGRVDDPAEVGGFATIVYLPGLVYTPQGCGDAEVLFEPKNVPFCGQSETGGVGHGNVGIGLPFDAWTNAPSLVRMPDVVCEEAGDYEILLMAEYLDRFPSPTGGSKYKTVDGSDILLNTTGVEREIDDGVHGEITVDVADILTVTCV